MAEVDTDPMDFSVTALSSWGTRGWLSLDAAVTSANGLAYVVLSNPLEDLLGPSAEALVAIGLFLLAFAAVVASASRQIRPGRGVVASIVGINSAWTVASIITAMVNPIDLTAAGRAWVLVQAAVVGTFAAMQHRSSHDRINPTIAANPDRA